MVYNDYYKPTGSAWVQFNHSRNASLFAKYVNQKTFYGNKLNVELMVIKFYNLFFSINSN